MPNYRELIEEYKNKKRDIKRRLKELSGIYKSSNKKVFPELCFCLLTPQSNARHCDKAVQELKRRGLIFRGDIAGIGAILKGKARFHNKKAGYIVGARRVFDKDIFSGSPPLKIRDSLVKKIKGLGYKEASHFLRNIGLGREIAILDRHILKNLKKYGAIRRIPPSVTPKVYLDIEEKAKRFAKRINIPLEELDLLFWSKETGEIFK